MRNSPRMAAAKLAEPVYPYPLVDSAITTSDIPAVELATKEPPTKRLRTTSPRFASKSANLSPTLPQKIIEPFVYASESEHYPTGTFGMRPQVSGSSSIGNNPIFSHTSGDSQLLPVYYF